MESLDGIVEQVTFYAEDSGYSVFQLKVQHSKEPLTVVGELPAVFAGESVRLSGQWLQHPKYGQQFRAHSCEKLLPASINGLQRYLGSGLIKGVGPVTARRMIKTFGMDVVKVLEEEPDRLLEIPLIGPRKRDQIVASWREHREIQNLMIFLQQYGVSTGFAVKIYREYGDRALEVVKTNPYQLAEEVWGVGFKLADQLAQKLGMASDNPHRLDSGLLYALQKASEDGHVYLSRQSLYLQAADLLAVPVKLLPDALLRMAQRDSVVLEGDPENPDVFLMRYWLAEVGVAERLRDLMGESEPLDHERLEAWLLDYQKEVRIEFSPEQEQAVRLAAASKIFILTGGPGTGKTTISRAILDWFEYQNLHLMLASPTGRAAKRLSEVTGREACTIHRLIEFDPHQAGFNRNEDAPLDTDLLLLDEVSMVDILLCFHLLKALPNAIRLILVGDADQLPSVGAGSVLHDLISSGVVPALELKTIFRQAEASRIVRNAHQVNQGELPVLLPVRGAHRHEDAFFVSAESAEAAVTQVVELVSQRLPKAGHEPMDIQVLCPMNRGPLGTQVLNQQLQNVLNPPAVGKEQIERGQKLLRVGDRVIQLRNNYEHEVFNGDLGEVLRIDHEDNQLIVQFPEKAVSYDFSELDELNLAYALTIHKSQGSEFPIVIMPLTMNHYVMLQRNLLYTGMTRARKLLILVGQQRAIEQSVRQQSLRQRQTRLDQRLQDELEPVLETPAEAC